MKKTMIGTIGDALQSLVSLPPSSSPPLVGGVPAPVAPAAVSVAPGRASVAPGRPSGVLFLYESGLLSKKRTNFL